eukprot:1507885-Rhodomonas_salina.6
MDEAPRRGIGRPLRVSARVAERRLQHRPPCRRRRRALCVLLRFARLHAHAAVILGVAARARETTRATLDTSWKQAVDGPRAELARH